DPRRFRAIHNHSMMGWTGNGPITVMWGDGSLEQIPPDLPLWQKLRNREPGRVSHWLAQYNHYATKTWDSFMVRRDRGRGAVAEPTAENARHTEGYFADLAEAWGPEPSIDRYAAEVEAKMAQIL